VTLGGAEGGFYFSFNLLIEVVNILIILSLLITYYLLLITYYLLLITYYLLLITYYLLLITYYLLLITYYLKNAKNNFSPCKFYSARIVHEFLTPSRYKVNSLGMGGNEEVIFLIPSPHPALTPVPNFNRFI
jgi:hypothetical protein